MSRLNYPIEGLIYSLDRSPTARGKRTVVSVRLEDGPDGPPGVVDRLDLYAFRSRRALAGLVAEVSGRKTDEILGHLALLLDETERGQEAPTAKLPELSQTRRKAATRLLERPDLLARVADAAQALGYVGEERAKRLAYLVATSRLLARPLSLILQAPSGCGKSELLDVIARLIPAESVEFLSRLTPQALYYAGSDSLRHKLVVVDEQAGASEADYAIRTLQSKGLLRLAVPAQGRTEAFTVHGPISLMSGTTSSTLNPENLSRVLELSLDDSPTQTERIQRAQRLAWAGRRPSQPKLETLLDAQRVLESRPVVIPFAPELTFPARTTADRRGNQKLLGLVAAHALLHQRLRSRDDADRVVAEEADYEVVFGLLQPVVERDVTGLSPRAARLYRLLAERPVEATRREVARNLGWGYNTAKRALAELVEQELVQIAERGPPATYRLIDASILGATGHLLPPERLSA